MVRVAILGATGYTALESIKLLLRNPEVQITAATTRQEGSPSIASIHHSLAGQLDLACEDLTPAQIAERADFALCCLPHGASTAVIPQLIDAGVRVVDLSADYRLNDPDVYKQWYGLEHSDKARLGQTVYGLPELFRGQIPHQNLVANPGCYTSTSILALAPLLKEQLIEPTGIIIDAKSGVSGAGRSPKQGTLFAECNESISAYGVGGHRHMPEIEQVLTDFSGAPVDVIFTPHLTPMDRGILATIYAKPITDRTADELMATLRDFYADAPFVKVVDHIPATKDVAGTNFFHVTLRKTKNYITILAVLDNLLKGASGVAVQNFNLMAGFPETTGLL
jgi:N-acetyl-gamma-glutamyl-phosphate reductase